MLRILILLLAGATGLAFGQAHEFVQAKLLAQAPAQPVRSQMLVSLKRGSLGKNRIRGRRFRIHDREFDGGIAMPSPGEIHVILDRPAAAFDAIVGVDSNDLGYYSNQGRGGVQAVVEVAGREVFRSPILSEGLPGVPIHADLQGGREFLLKLEAAGPKSRFYQAEWDQADWALAKVTLSSGDSRWLADLPIGPLEEPPTVGLPFSFRYDGRSSQEVLPEWKAVRTSRRLDSKRMEYSLSFTNPSDAVGVRAVAVEYLAFPAVEWTLYFRNGGKSASAIFEDIQALDTSFSRGGGGEFQLHHSLGSRTRPDDYMPMETELAPNAEKALSSIGGRGSDGELPYFNLAWAGHGVVIAVGWPGQWAARFTRDADRSAQVRAGQELTHFRLEPGEEVRSPLIVLVFYDGDWLAGQNVWRRWMVADNLPRPGGNLHPPQVAEGSGRQTVEMQEANEQNQIAALTRELDHGLPLDYWWMDAGWYPFAEGWPDTGTWEPDPQRFPRGFAPIAKAAHERGVKTLVWFEPERVRPGTWLALNHPEWLLKRTGAKDLLLDLGNDQARQWLTDHVSRLIREQGIDLYRQDFNFEPLRYWREHDAPDRQGLTEIKHVTGYLAYWDALRSRFPNMTIDTCASGGRRNDLETLRRAVPLWRSDEAYDPVAMQAISYGIALWIPYYGTGVNSVEPYLFRSQMTPAIGIGLDPGSYPNGYEKLKKLLAQWREVAGDYNGDYYPLTPYSLESTSWMAWQFDSPAKGEGMVQAFRRPDSPFETARFQLRGLDPKRTYVIRDADSGETTRMSGAELLERGLPVTLRDSPGAALIAYRAE